MLVKKVRPDNTYTLYIGGLYELELNASNGVTKKTSYYPGGAMRVEVVGGANTVYYLLKDHLGSASVVLDSSGVVIANGEQRYYPYGEKRITTAALPTDRLYTGQLELASLGGIYHYGARFYSPRLGRFLSADSIVPNFANPQSLNRFAYVLNNPLKYTDPTGHLPSYCQRFPAECRAEFGAVAPPYQPRVAPPVSLPPSSGGGGNSESLKAQVIAPLKSWSDVNNAENPEAVAGARLLLAEMGDRLILNQNWVQEGVAILWTVQNRVTWMANKQENPGRYANTFTGCEEFVSCAGGSYATNTDKGIDPLFYDPDEPDRRKNYYAQGQADLAVEHAIQAAVSSFNSQANDPTGGAQYFSHACEVPKAACFRTQTDIFDANGQYVEVRQERTLIVPFVPYP